MTPKVDCRDIPKEYRDAPSDLLLDMGLKSRNKQVD